MPRIRPNTKRGEWIISKHAFYTVLHYALQYNEWVDRYNALSDTSQAIRYDKDKIQTSVSPDQVERVAIERTELKAKIDLVDNTAAEASDVLKTYILKAVTNEGITYDYLDSIMNIPCSKNTFYDRKRKFYYLLSRKLGL